MTKMMNLCNQHKHVVIVDASSEPVGRVFDNYDDALNFFHEYDESVIACVGNEHRNRVK